MIKMLSVRIQLYACDGICEREQGKHSFNRADGCCNAEVFYTEESSEASTARRSTAAKYACYQVKLKRIQQSMLGWANTCEWRCVLLCPVQSCRWSGSSFLYVPTTLAACSSVHHLKHTDLSACNHQSSSLLPGNIEHYTVTLASLLD